MIILQLELILRPPSLRTKPHMQLGTALATLIRGLVRRNAIRSPPVYGATLRRRGLVRMILSSVRAIAYAVAQALSTRQLVTDHATRVSAAFPEPSTRSSILHDHFAERCRLPQQKEAPT
jgi:hypothetical protein